MAKKKSKKKVKGNPKKGDYQTYFYIGVIILVIIIIIIIKSGKEETGPADIEITSAEEAAETEEPELEGAAEKNDCGIGAAIGYRACDLLDNGDVKLTILHQGQDTLAGMKYYIYDENKEKIAEASETGMVAGGAEASYILPISQYAAANKVMIAPVIDIEGADYICLNQGIIVTPSINCR